MTAPFKKTFCESAFIATSPASKWMCEILHALMTEDVNDASVLSIGHASKFKEATRRLGSTRWKGEYKLVQIKPKSVADWEVQGILKACKKTRGEVQKLVTTFISLNTQVTGRYELRSESEEWESCLVDLQLDRTNSTIDVRKVPLPAKAGYATSLVFSRTDAWEGTYLDPYEAVQAVAMIPDGGEIMASGEANEKHIAFPSFTCELWGVPRTGGTSATA